MKKLLATTLLLFTTSCTLTALSAVNYNNRIVTEMTALSNAVDLSSTNYNEALPSPVTEQVDVDVSGIIDGEEALEGALENVGKLMEVESKDDEQELQVRAKLQAYIDAANAYQEAYNAMLTYYQSEEYKNDITKVTTHDDAVYEAYNNFVQANNELAETLERYVN